MSKLYFFILLFFCLEQSNYAQVQIYTLDPSASTIEWKGHKIGGEHEGTIKAKESEIKVVNGSLQSGYIIIDMNSLIITDIESEKQNKKLWDVFAHEGFFDIENYPVARYDFKSTDPIGSSRIELNGSLKIKNTRQDFPLPLQFISKSNQVQILGSIDINRMLYDIRYSDGFLSAAGDKAIKDLFNLDFDLQFIPKDSSD